MRPFAPPAAPPVDAPFGERVAGIFTVRLEDTEWYGRAREFLREHPGSSLLSIVHYLWPDFLSFPSARRAQTWFWMKEQLLALSDRGLLRNIIDEDGVTIWSLPPDRPSPL